VCIRVVSTASLGEQKSIQQVKTCLVVHLWVTRTASLGALRQRQRQKSIQEVKTCGMAGLWQRSTAA
jgi:hypothetical protein